MEWLALASSRRACAREMAKRFLCMAQAIVDGIVKGRDDVWGTVDFVIVLSPSRAPVCIARGPFAACSMTDCVIDCLPWQVRAHVARDGCLVLFPEAKLNRNPETLCPFRKGAFAIAEDMGMAVVTLASVGNNECWPIDAVVGGLPSRVSMKISHVAEAGHGLTAEEIRQKSHEVLQGDVTSLFAERRVSKTKLS